MSRVPTLNSGDVCGCFRPFNDTETICQTCVDLYDIVECARNGTIDGVVKDKLMPIRCPDCVMQFTDKNGLAAHASVHVMRNNLCNDLKDPRRMTASQLREELLARNPNAYVKGTKNDLVNRLEAAIYADS